MKQNNIEYEKSKEEDIEQENGYQYKPAPPWKKRNKNNFISHLFIDYCKNN